MESESIFFNKQEALRYCRAQPGDGKAEAAVDAAYQKLKKELQPRFAYKKFCCDVSEEEVRLDNGAVFHSKALARYLGNAKEIFLFGATLGSRVDMTLRRISLTSVAEAGAAQAVAAALIETYCDDCCRELQQQLPEGKKLKWRFSPGYGDWALEEQKILFSVLDCAHTIGLTLTESCMMAPIKSVTAVIAILDSNAKEQKEINIHKNIEEKIPDKTENNLKNKILTETNVKENNLPSVQNGFAGPLKNKCRYCGKADCEFRRKE